METLTGTHLLLVVMGGAIMSYVMLKAIGQSAMATASREITTRRAAVLQRRIDDAAAEAAGRAAALEPLAVNADGTLEEPILATAETPV